MELVYAVIFGLLFGFALNRAGATNPQNIIGMLRLSDLRLMKAILCAIGLSSIAMFGTLGLNILDPSHVSIKTAYVGVFVGGLLLGAGFAIAGYCPGTGLAALATGRKDALFFVVGGLLGAFVFTLTFGWIEENTTMFDKIAGGAVSLADTGNEKYEALLTMNGTFIGIGQGIVFSFIAWFLPNDVKCPKKEESQS